VSYSRAITAPEVLRAATGAVGISRGTAGSRLSATPVPGSTVIRVTATGASNASAVALANAASTGLRNYVIRLNRTPQSAAMLRDFQQAQREVVAAQRRVARAQGSGSAASLQRARLDLQTAQLKASTLEGQYKYQSGTTPPPNLVQILSPATTASSDFRSRLEELLLIGLVAGVVVGLALALLRANAESLLRLRA
jgi:capsular polysaccharide biosynthesis protein